MESPKEPLRSLATRQHLLSGLLLLALAVQPFLPALRGGFIWDDDVTVTANVITRPGGLAATWFSTAQPNYWPVTWSALWLQWQLWGANPAGFHAVNLLLHAACALLLWRLLLRLRVPAAWLGAALFAVHPANAESAVWITQQKTLFSTGFGLAAFLLYRRYRDGEGARWYGLSVVAFALSLLSKSATVCLPVVFLITDLWREGRLRRRDFRLAAPFLALSLAAGLGEIWFQYHRALAGDVRSDPLALRALTATHAALYYLRTAIAPLNLCFIPPTPEIKLTAPAAWAVPLGWVLAASVAWSFRRGWGRHALFAGAAYLTMLAPILGLLNIYFMRYSWVADHWQYPAIAAPLAALAALWRCAQDRLSTRASAVLWRAAIAALIVAHAAQSVGYAVIYSDAERVWRDTIARNPQAWMAWGNLGGLLADQGRFEEAEPMIRRAVELSPDGITPRMMLARCLERRGDTNGALAALEQTLTIQPDHAPALYERGRIRLRAGDAAAARADFEAAATAPAYAAPHVGLAMLARGEGRNEDALKAVGRALALAPHDIEALHLRGDITFDFRRYAEARADYALVRELNPDYPGIDNELGTCAALSGDVSAAVQFFRRALERNPSDPNARRNLEQAERDLARQATSRSR